MTLPSEYRRLGFWHKADALALADGSAIASITDFSGNSHHLVQATSGNQATAQTQGGISVIRPDGVDDFYTMSYDLTKRTRMTYYAVIRAPQSATDQMLIEHSTSTTATIGGWNVYRDTIDRIAATTRNPISGVMTKRSRYRVNTQFAIIAIRFDVYTPREQALVYVNGRVSRSQVIVGSQPAHGYRGTWPGHLLNTTLYQFSRAGTSLFYGGDLAEQMFFEEFHTPEQFYAMHAYLATKYGITDVLAFDDLAGAIVFDGNSLTEGAPAAPPQSWPNYVMNYCTQNVEWINPANQGRTNREGWEDFYMELSQWFTESLPRNVTMWDAPTNDINYGVVEPTARRYYEGQYTDLGLMGLGRLAHTMIDRNDPAVITPHASFIASQTAFNTWLRSRPDLYDVLVDLADDSRYMNADDPLYFNTGDRVHQSDLLYRIQAKRMAAALAATWGFTFLPFGSDAITAENQTPLKFWYDAAYYRALPNNTAIPASWEDVSLFILAVPKNLSNGTAANRGVVITNAQNGLPVLRMDGTNDAMTSPGNIDLSATSGLVVFIVVSAIASGDAGIILELSANSDTATDGFKIEHLANNHVKATVKGDVGLSDFETNAVITGPTLLTVIMDKTLSTNEVSILVNGAPESGIRANNSNNTNAFGNTSLNFAARNGTATQILALDACEIVGVDTTLSSGDIDAWEQYLCTKWGITWAG